MHTARELRTPAAAALACMLAACGAATSPDAATARADAAPPARDAEKVPDTDAGVAAAEDASPLAEDAAPLPGDAGAIEPPRPCREALAPARRDPGAILEAVDACVSLRDAIVWQAPRGELRPFAQWSPAERTRLREVYQALAGGAALPFTCPDPASQRAVGTPPSRATALFYREAQAFDLFVAQVANALLVEVEEIVPWSLAALGPEERAWLLSSTSLFAIIVPSAASEVPPWAAYQTPARRSNAPSFLCDPRDGLDVVRGPGNLAGRPLIGGSPLETLANLTLWLAANAYHGAGASDAELPRYGYSLRERLRAWPGQRAANAVYGCQSAAHMLSDLARSVNLALIVAGEQDLDGTSGHYLNRTHAGLLYQPDSASPLVLLHADDLYALQDRAWIAPSPGALFGDTIADRDAFFANKWQTPEAAERWGFSIARGFPLVVPGAGIGANGRGVYETYADYGRYIGAWRPGASDPAAQRFSSRAMAYHAESQYTLCGAQLLRESCGPADFAQRLEVVFYGGALSPENPIARTAQDYTARAAACLAPAGGCAGLAPYQARWFGTTYGAAVAR